MDTQNLSAFLNVADNQSFSLAAEKLHQRRCRAVARLAVGSEAGRRWLGLVPTTATWLLSLECPQGERILRSRFRNGVGLAYDPPTPPLEIGDGAAVATWSGTEAVVRDAHGWTVGTVGTSGPLSNALHVRDARSGVRTPIERLPRATARGLALEVPRRGDVFRFAGPRAEQLDARLLLAWPYALAMREAQR
mgnify:CR=1 FL=1